MRGLLAVLGGVLFAVGLGVSGMTDPAKVRGFLDVAGEWDPRLLAVMAGAILVHLPLRAWILAKRRAPLFGRFERASEERPDVPLVLGATLFGVGWGGSGFCPGPAWVSLFHGAPSTAIFVVGLAVGILGFRVLLASNDDLARLNERTSC